MDTDAVLAGGETLTVEFKMDLNDDELAKAVACLANGEGGVLLIGVDDDGTVLGARPRHNGTTLPDRVAAVIQSKTQPHLSVSVHVDVIDDHDIIRIDVPRADPGPIGTMRGTFTRRTIGTDGKPLCRPMSAQEIVSMGMVSRGQDYAQAPAGGARLDDLDPQEFDRFRALCRGSDPGLSHLTDGDILTALGLVPQADPVSLGAVLLFGTPQALHRWIPTAEVLFQDLRPDGPQVNVRIVAPLLRVAEEVGALLEERRRDAEIMVGMYRVELPLIPSVTRREAIVNALVHRDYATVGPVVIQLTESTFTVTSPGGFPPGVTTRNVLQQSRPRSQTLADVFKRAGFAERRGKGVNDMFEQQLRAGRSAPDYSNSTPESVAISVSLDPADLDLVRFLMSWESDHQQTLRLDELRVVHEVKVGGSVDHADLAGALAMSSSDVRSATGRLLEKGILEARGTGRSRRYHLTSHFYDFAEDRSSYVRIKGPDPMQQRRMILDYVDAYGAITRGQAAELCQVSPTRARAVLKQLVVDGALRLVGQRRGSRYVAATPGME